MYDKSIFCIDFSKKKFSSNQCNLFVYTSRKFVNEQINTEVNSRFRSVFRIRRPLYLPVHEFHYGCIEVISRNLDDVTISKPIDTEYLCDDDLVHASDLEVIHEKCLRLIFISRNRLYTNHRILCSVGLPTFFKLGFIMKNLLLYVSSDNNLLVNYFFFSSLVVFCSFVKTTYRCSHY